jgi:aldehyde:ferredoxin oxidoreductase
VEIPPGNQNTVGFRTYKSVFDLGPAAEKYTVKMSGCHSCPIRCMTQMNIPRVKEFGVPGTGGNTCVANFVHTTIFPNGPKDFEDKDDGRVIGNLVGLNIKDDKVSLEKADFLWGKGTRATTEEICRLTSPETCVAAIGQACSCNDHSLVPVIAIDHAFKGFVWRTPRGAKIKMTEDKKEAYKCQSKMRLQ